MFAKLLINSSEGAPASQLQPPVQDVELISEESGPAGQAEAQPPGGGGGGGLFARLLQAGPQLLSPQTAPPLDVLNLPSYTVEDLAKHSNRKDLWIVIEGLVYDVTEWQKQHPGGAAALLQYAGRDATDAASIAHEGKTKVAMKMQELCIGTCSAEFGSQAETKELVTGVPTANSPLTSPRGRRGTRNMQALDLRGMTRQVDPGGEHTMLNTDPPPPPRRNGLHEGHGIGPGSPRHQSPLTNDGRSPRRGSLSTSFNDTGGEGGEGASEVGQAELGANINIHTFDELRLDSKSVFAASMAWETFCIAQGTKEVAGEAIFNCLFEGAPSLQALFTTPRAIQAMRFMNSMQGLVNSLGNPKQLKASVEMLGFNHMNLEVTLPRVVIFRDSITELLEIELGDEFTEHAREGLVALLNYVGGAIIFIKTHYSERLQVLADSWRKATDPEYSSSLRKPTVTSELTKGTDDVPDDQLSNGQLGLEVEGSPITQSSRLSRRWRWGQRHDTLPSGRSNGSPGSGGSAGGSSAGEGSPRTAEKMTSSALADQMVVRTFQAMFDFNAAVMGFSSSAWLREVVNSFDAIVTNISHSARLQEECDFLVLKIAKCHTRGEVNLAEFKSCMLATLRSLLPKEWDSTHEVAWNWLWDNVERLLKTSLGKPKQWAPALRTFLDGVDAAAGYKMRAEIYRRFFGVAPVGMEHFKQSDTRLHFIAERSMQMTIELLEEPHRMIDHMSSLGLRHVGYGIPTELIGPLVMVYVEVVSESCSQQPLALEAFRWSLWLVSKILVRTINEGSTIVMQAINANSVPQLKHALACAPRASRANWLLKVEAGTQNISPLMWAIESGRLEAAEAIIQDLLVIRADRERYYYGVEDLFGRHQDIIKRLISDAPTLLPVIMQGLVWRSRISRGGNRRVNYYVKHLLINPEDDSVSDTLSWLVAAKNPRNMSHEAIVLVSDTMWNGLIYREFMYSKIWFMISLMFFMLSQAILPKSDSAHELHMRLLIFAGRLLMYVVTMVRFIFQHSKFCMRSYREGDTMTCCRCLKIPTYLRDPRDSGGFLLMLLLMMMCALEPMFHCLPEAQEEFPSQTCYAAEKITYIYSVFCMGAMAIHWLLLIDLSVFSTGLSAFVLVISKVLSEMNRFLITLLWLLLTFGSAISVLEHPYFEMRDIPNTAIALFSITVRLFEDDYRSMIDAMPLLCIVFVFVTASCVVLLNLLIAQINCSYMFIYQDMVGFARLNRADVICETLEKAPEETWLKFVKTLNLNEPLEFNEGDVGLPGGIQVLELAGVHPVTEDSILRFGGSCALDTPWPEDSAHHEEEDKYTRIQKMLKKVLKRVSKKKIKGRGGGRGGGVDGMGATNSSSGNISSAMISEDSGGSV